MPAGDRYLLLVNPSAGGGRASAILPEVERTLQARGLDHRTVATEGVEHGRREALIAAEAGEVVVVMSGDGLIGQVGGTLAGTGGTLAVIPGGRGNDLARVLGIPTDVTAAVDLLADGAARLIDVGEVNGSRFLGIASCGFDSDANRIANEAKLIKGNLVYAYAAIRALIAWKPARFVLRLDGTHREFTGFSVAAANSKAYGGGMFVAPDAELDDGLFDVVTVADVSKLRALRGMPKVFKGTHVDDEYVRVERAAELTIDADRPFAVYADGDHVADLPATLRLLPSALRVIAPG
jgi:YegS/Rv2252/BmrU family lipid kinase